MMKTDLEDYL